MSLTCRGDPLWSPQFALSNSGAITEGRPYMAFSFMQRNPLSQTVIIGTRGSKLALWQTNWVKSQLERLHPGLQVDIEIISTKGDRVLDVSLPKLGEQGKGLFTKELEEAIHERSDDATMNEIISKLNHEATRLACEAERAFLKGLGGGCLVPIAAHAEIAAAKLTLTGLVASTDGREIVRGNVSGPSQDAEQLGQQLAKELIAQGADQILARN